jgi:hypothetical protein
LDTLRHTTKNAAAYETRNTGFKGLEHRLFGKWVGTPRYLFDDALKDFSARLFT